MTFRRILFFYQLLTGLSDTSTGILLIAAPAVTLHLMGLSARSGSLLFLSFVGVFVLSVGVACLYGAWLARLPVFAFRLREVWILTAIARGLVAIFLLFKMLRGELEPGWSSAAVSDGLLALIQIVGLQRGWLNIAQR
jgi:hypothetical protein